MLRNVGHVTKKVGRVMSWNIPDFPRLPIEVDFLIESPQFCWANITFRLQMYPNGRTGWTESRAVLLIERCQEIARNPRIGYVLGVLRSDDSIADRVSGDDIFDLPEALGLSRGTANTEASMSNGSLTVFCSLHFTRDKKTPITLRNVGQVTNEVDGGFSWIIPDFPRLPIEVDFVRKSPQFGWNNIAFRLQMYPNGRIGWRENRAVLLIERCQEISRNPGIGYVLGVLRNDGSIVDHVSGDDIFDLPDALELSRERANREASMSNGSLTVFCSLHISRNIKSPITLRNVGYVANQDVGRFSWKIPDFPRLPIEVDIVIESPQFGWNNIAFSLQMYPNGKIGCRENRLVLRIERCQENSRNPRIGYVLGVLRTDGSIVDHVSGDDIFDLPEALGLSRERANTEASMSNGSLTVFCSLHISRDLKSPIMLRNVGHVKNQGVGWFSWKIPNFPRLPIEVHFVIESPQFGWNNIAFRLQMYPNGKIGCRENRAVLLIERCQEISRNPRIGYVLGVLRNDGLIVDHVSGDDIFDLPDALELSRERSNTESSLSNGSLTVFCSLHISRDLQLQTNQGVGRFRWKIPDFPRLPREVDFVIESEQIRWANITFRLKMYPNGRTGWRGNRMVLLIERFQEIPRNPRIAYVLGVMRSDSSSIVDNVFGDDIFDLPEALLLSRERANTEASMSNGSLTVFCSLQISSDLE